MLPKVEVRPKGPPLGFFGTVRLFAKIIEFYQRVPPCIFWSFRFLKTFNEPKWPLLKIFGIVRLFKKILFWNKNFPNLSNSYFFFRLQSSHWSFHFLEAILKPPKATSRQGKLSPKCPPFHFLLFQGILQIRTCLKGPPLDFFSALCEIFWKKKIKNFKFFPKKCFALFEP